MKTMEEAIKELQEAAIVMAHLQSRQAKMLKDHADWLQEHDRAMTEFRERLDQTRHQDAERGRKLDERIDKLAIEWRERGRQIDERIDKLVLAIGEMIRRSNGK